MTFLSLWRWFHSLAAYYSRSTHWKSSREWLGQGWCKASFRLILFLSDHPPFSTGQSLWYVEHRSHHSQISKRNSTEIEVALSQPRCIPCFPFKHNVSFIHWQKKKKKLTLSRSCQSLKLQGAAVRTSRWGHHQRSLFFCWCPFWFTMCWIMMRHQFGIWGWWSSN